MNFLLFTVGRAVPASGGRSGVSDCRSSSIGEVPTVWTVDWSMCLVGAHGRARRQGGHKGRPYDPLAASTVPGFRSCHPGYNQRRNRSSTSP